MEEPKESNKEKFLKLVSPKKSDLMEKVRWRIANREGLRKARKISLNILIRLDTLKWSKWDLAREMGVSNDTVSKWVSGSFLFDDEELIRKLEEKLGCSLIKE